jgi:hypothetical protein
MKNMFYSKDNLSKLCAEGAIRNLMDMFQCSEEDMSTFWELATFPLLLIKSQLKKIQSPRLIPVTAQGLILFRNACGSFVRSSNLPQQQTLS